MNDLAGKYFRGEPSASFMTRGDDLEASVTILILDPVLGSRFSLAQAVSEPDYVVKTAATIEQAIVHLEHEAIALVIVEEHLSEGNGIEFLVDVRDRFPETRRALVTESEGVSFIRDAIERAGLSFLLSKPWSPSALRQTLREVLGGDPEFAGWSGGLRAEERSAHQEALLVDRPGSDRQHEILLRGLLAGLNSCEFETEVFELVHTELALPFHVSRWLWFDEQSRIATRIAGDWPVESNVSFAALTREEAGLVARARQSLRVTRLDEVSANAQADASRKMCLSLPIRDQGIRTMTGLIFVDQNSAAQLVLVLRELQTGLEMAFHRIRMAKVRAIAARRLARRVSEELRTPVGALTHAIDRLRGEAERAGMPTEWVDRVSSESERVARAVEHLEGEMLTDENGLTSTVG